MQWISRTSNQQAYFISRLIDTDDWQVIEEFFLFFDGRWGLHSVDCFANYYNNKLPKYFRGFGTRTLRVLNFSFSLFEEKIA